MSIAIRLTESGGPDVLRIETITEARPAQGEVWIEQEAIGVNVLDVTQRNGSVPIHPRRSIRWVSGQGAGRDKDDRWRSCRSVPGYRRRDPPTATFVTSAPSAATRPAASRPKPLGSVYSKP
jgi:hypothetical protein